MKQYRVTGMSCAACSARVEKAVTALRGVRSCAVNLLTGSMGVAGDVDPQEVIAAVRQAGYDASVASSADAPDKTVILPENDLRPLRQRLWFSVGLLLILMYISMGHTMWGWPLPAFFTGNPVAVGLLQLLLSAAILMINRHFFISGIRGLLHRAPNMDTLVSLGAAAAFIYSTCLLFAMTAAQKIGDSSGAAALCHSLYFESAAMILTLIDVGKTLEARSKGKTTDALRSLMCLAPQTASVLRDGQELTVAVQSVRPGDLFVVRPGENIPVDGVVLEGGSAVNEAALTGESLPADKAPGDEVFSATLNLSGFLKCRATRVGEDTTLSQIIRMVSDAAATKAPIAKIADRVSGIFVPTVLVIAAVTTILWLLLSHQIGYALSRGISVLVISCPCALGLATPVAIMVGSGVGARNGILFKTAAALEETGRIQIVALDKTGTVTCGEPRVTDLVPEPGISEHQLLQAALSLEQKSEHPLARAILLQAQGEGVQPQPVQDFEAVPGHGLQALLDGCPIYGGSLSFISRHATVSDILQKTADTLAEDGKTPLLFCHGGRLLGLIAVADTLKEDSAQAVRRLQEMGLRVVILTGDNKRTARAVAAQAGIDEVLAEVLPQGKQEAICRLQESGKVCMVGDGINDAPALTKADIGIAIGAGADVAIDAADVVLIKSRLSDVPAAIRLGRATVRNIHQNLFWAFFYNLIGIPLAAGVLIPLGLTLSPMFGAAAMSLSSFCVVSNALRLNLLKPHRAKQPQTTQKQNFEKKESISMQKTLHIEGMMCAHCEATVKKALEDLPCVGAAQVDHRAGVAVVTLTAPADDDLLRRAVEERGYTVTAVS